jgi:hypothetical protein
MIENLIKVYVRLVTNKNYTIDQVPAFLRDGVEKKIAEEEAKAAESEAE